MTCSSARVNTCVFLGSLLCCLLVGMFHMLLEGRYRHTIYLSDFQYYRPTPTSRPWIYQDLIVEPEVCMVIAKC